MSERRLRKADGGRRLRGVLVSGRLVAEVFSDGWSTRSPERSIETHVGGQGRPAQDRRITVSGGVPAGAVLYQVLEAPNDEWLLLFEHDSFEPLQPGAAPPLMRPMVTAEPLEDPR